MRLWLKPRHGPPRTLSAENSADTASYDERTLWLCHFRLSVSLRGPGRGAVLRQHDPG